MPFGVGGFGGAGGACGCCGGATCRQLCTCFDVPDTIQLTDSALGITLSLPFISFVAGWGTTYNYAYPGLGGCAATTVALTYTVSASGGCGVSLNWSALGTHCPDNSGGAVSAGNTLAMSSCSPPAAATTLSDANADTPGVFGKLYGVGVTTTITVSTPGAWACCVRFVAVSCDGSTAVVGATVNVYTDSTKATLVVSGVTDSQGRVILNSLGSAGTYYYEVLVGGNVLGSGTQAFTCGQSKTVTAGCKQTFAVRGCNSAALQGATVTVWTDSGKTTQLATGTTDAGGNVTLYWNATCATSVYVEVSCPRFVTYTNTGAYTCAATTTVSLSAASGYHCAGCSAIPLADTLHLTDSVYGSTTLSYSAGNWVSGTTSWSFPGDVCCSAASFGMIYTLTGSTCALSATYGHGPPVVGVPECPTGTGRQTDVGAGSTTVSKPTYCGDATAWNFSASVPATTCPASDTIYIYPGGATYTMTE